MMTIGVREGRIFLSHPHMNNGFFFLLTTKYHILYWKYMKRLPENPEFAEMRHGDIIAKMSWIDVRPSCDCLFLSFPRAGTGV